MTEHPYIIPSLIGRQLSLMVCRLSIADCDMRVVEPDTDVAEFNIARDLEVFRRAFWCSDIRLAMEHLGDAAHRSSRLLIEIDRPSQRDHRERQQCQICVEQYQ